MKCELVKKKEGYTEFAVVREKGKCDLAAWVLAHDRSDIRLLWLKKWRFPRRGYNNCDVFVVKKISLGNYYVIEHWRLYEPPEGIEGKPYVLRRFRIEVGYAADHEEELPVHPVFVWERVGGYSVRDIVRELKASVESDVSVLFERLSHVIPFGP